MELRTTNARIAPGANRAEVCRCFAVFLVATLVLTGCGEIFGGDQKVCRSAGDKTWRKRAGSWSLPGRVEYHESTNSALRDAASSTALLVSAGDLRKKAHGYVLSSDGKKKTCCAKGTKCRPYGGQRAFGRCTGFLVGERTLVTAGHCESRVECSSQRVVFGAYYEDPSAQITPIPNEDVYSCERVLARKQNQIFDYAILRLGRPVEGRSPLPLRKSGTVASGDAVGLVGGPGGVPLKLSVGGRVSDRDFKEAFFVEELKATTGDSGAPLLNLQSGKVEALHVGEHPELEWTAGLRIGCFRGKIPGYSTTDDCNQENY